MGFSRSKERLVLIRLEAPALYHGAGRRGKAGGARLGGALMAGRCPPAARSRRGGRGRRGRGQRVVRRRARACWSGTRLGGFFYLLPPRLFSCCLFRESLDLALDKDFFLILIFLKKESLYFAECRLVGHSAKHWLRLFF